MILSKSGDRKVQDERFTAFGPLNIVANHDSQMLKFTSYTMHIHSSLQSPSAAFGGLFLVKVVQVALFGRV